MLRVKRYSNYMSFNYPKAICNNMHQLLNTFSSRQLQHACLVCNYYVGYVFEHSSLIDCQLNTSLIFKFVECDVW